MLRSLSVTLLMLATLVPCAGASTSGAGPSVPCAPAPVDALNRLTCTNVMLARAEIRLVQTYYALRHSVGTGGQNSLKSEFLSFIVATRRTCGLPPVEPSRDQSQFPLTANAASCVAVAYDAQRIAWTRRLPGPAAEEAARAPEQNFALQSSLHRLGFIPQNASIDGIFGTGTRNAMLAWQRAKGRAETGFFNDADASILLAAAPAQPRDPFANWRVEPLAQAEYRGTPVTIAHDSLQVSLDMDISRAGAACMVERHGEPWPDEDKRAERNVACRSLVLRITVDGKDVVTKSIALFGNESVFELVDFRIAIRKLDPSTALPQVTITDFSGGAHCCTTTRIATARLDSVWNIVQIGNFGDEGVYDFFDPLLDGTIVLANYRQGFNYAFSSYGGSFSPTHLYSFTGSMLEDVSRNPRYRDIMLLHLKHMEEDAVRRGKGNGYFAGWIAQKILVDQLQDGWRTMLASYDTKAMDGLEVCTVDKRVWNKDIFGLVCPDGQTTLLTFPEALARRLAELGYLTPEQSAQIGFEHGRMETERETETRRYEEKLAIGWFVVTPRGYCALARSPSSPAEMIEAAQGRRTTARFTVLEMDQDEKPVVVRVDEPRGNNLSWSLTFYRGMPRCETSRQQQKKEIESLR